MHIISLQLFKYLLFADLEFGKNICSEINMISMMIKKFIFEFRHEY